MLSAKPSRRQAHSLRWRAAPWDEQHPDWLRLDQQLPADHRARQQIQYNLFHFLSVHGCSQRNVAAAIDALASIFAQVLDHIHDRLHEFAQISLLPLRMTHA